jgi:Tfp pilus assembly pilus retraction ATPase PilT
MPLADLPLIDLYIGEDFSEYRDKPGDDAPRLVVPEQYAEEVRQIRAACYHLYKEHKQKEFAFPHGDDLYRVTAIPDVTYEPILILSRAADTVPPLNSLGLPAHILSIITDKDARGLILIGGDQGAGKTTTMAAMLIERITALGGFGLALQDPIENNMRGLHGQGRIIQQPVEGVTGYAQAALTAVRARMKTISFGEVRRDPEGLNASTCVDLASSGCLILATIHASTLQGMIERLIELATPNMGDKTPNAVADALTAIVWQRLDTSGKHVRPVMTALSLADEQEATAIRALIRDKKLHQLSSFAQQQATRKLWSGR